ncbi:MAG: flagellar export protein FliJ [Defluviitaleaceae bacterium]|nr:flagellar export protein FliJ [Defluviitaleaceae bacterium]
MAKFSFKLASILSIKEKMEDLKKNEMAKAIQALEREKQRLRELVQTRLDCIDSFRNSINTGVKPEDIKSHNQYLEKLKMMIKAQEMVVEMATAFVEQKRLELVEAMREKKAMEKLKENAYEQHVIEEKQEEQKSIDEIVSYKTAVKG